MWGDLVVAILEVIGIAYEAGGDRPPGPPIDGGTGLLVLGLIVVVGGIVMRIVTHLPHAVSYFGDRARHWDGRVGGAMGRAIAERSAPHRVSRGRAASRWAGRGAVGLLVAALFSRNDLVAICLCAGGAILLWTAQRWPDTIRRLRRGREPGDHFCHGCRYDLTGNLSGTCPECGRSTRL